MQGGGDHPIAHLLAELGQQPGPGVLDRVLAARRWTAAEVRDRWAYDNERIARSGGRLTWGVFWTALLAGQLAPKNGATGLNPADYADNPLYRMGSDTAGLTDAPPGDIATPSDVDDESPSQAARRLLPEYAPYDDWIFVTCRLACGDSEPTALAELAQHRRARR